MNWSHRWKSSLRAAVWHFLASLLVAALAAALVFGVWYPYPYRELAGGRELFFIVVAVDVICGPLLTLVLFNPRKSKRELWLDLTLVAMVQLTALAYGIHTVAQARPVYLVFEVDRFKVVSAADVVMDDLKPELGGLQKLPWTGPIIIGIRGPRDSEEMLQSLDLSLQGVEPSARPGWWQTYDLSKAQVLARAKPLTDLRARKPDAAPLIQQVIEVSRLPEERLAWVPLTSFRSTEWVALIDRETAEVRAYAPVDGF